MINVIIYGADVVCASCVNAPTSKDIYDWIQPNLKRKFPELTFNFSYIDINNSSNLTDHDENIIEQINNDELFYPLIAMDDEIVADGYIQLPQVTKFVEQHYC
ncbi:YuzD family protein [Macrococcoides caseolyticum]|uniref:YuzD family protein n=1 Tax=Macrococcoides caseolyticum TaxID=69966 RepID=UPI000C3258E4|nr:YuzD family protein [Macrococcus caseolyticus]PKE11230.1 disulfide oxidoreductase [Macrococcus caseolyticus]PKE44958.1 disulfide oxidoreductase [Macrococcus caseolyticus]PKE47366.1 disulfide oxidoreductase [Macrococcus caseolyticus]PKF14229.1 disulfide oxidoreductase [Macrococcus caseolyticus]PNZ73410.1 disulfide oxidoreductase [Macrococcus caseolyticus]